MCKGLLHGPRTARKIIRGEESVAPPQSRACRTHESPLEPFWPEIEELLRQDSKLTPYIILYEMLSRHPDSFKPRGDAHWSELF